MATYLKGSAPSQLSLPDAPASQTGPVRAWLENLFLPIRLPGSPAKNPVFTEDRRRGEGYPLPVLEGSSSRVSVRDWAAVHIENEYFRLLVLPELNGRIHLALDKGSGREFLYREEAIGVDSTGRRAAGGLEVNWPSDPRSRALVSASVQIEEHGDGSRTVWCSTYDPLTRLKGMHGVCLYPGRAYIELKIRLANRTPFSHTFNWSSLAGVAVSQEQIAVFPTEDSGAGSGSFFGYYCPQAEAGLLQIADQQNAAGCSFTLRGEYAEVRAGVYSTLPPGVTALAPCETRSFSQFWYPFTRIGSVKKANVDAAVSLSIGDSITAGVAVTRPFPNAAVLLESEGTTLKRWTLDLYPGRPILEEMAAASQAGARQITLRVLTSTGRELISFDSGETPSNETSTNGKYRDLPHLTPRRIASSEDLFLTGVRAQSDGSLPSRAEEYWQELLRREPAHAAANHALGTLQLQRGEFGEAEARFRIAIATLAGARRSDVEDGEVFYSLGLALRYQEDDDGAFAAFQRASWSFAWRAASLHALAEIDCKRGNFGVVPKNLYESLRLNADNNNARSLAVVLFRRFGRSAEADQLVRESLTLDPLDPWACHLAGRPIPGDNQTRLDLAFDYARAGLYDLAVEILTAADTFADDGSLPMVHYTLATFYMRLGDFRSAQREFAVASQSQPDRCFPHRLEEMLVLARAIALQPEDARAQYLLGCMLYFYGLPSQAIEIWESSAKMDGAFPTVWRNLAIAYHNVSNEDDKALTSFDQAFAVDPSDPGVFLERDELWKRLGVPPTLRFTEFGEHRSLADAREELALELAALYNTNGQPEDALSLFSAGKLSSWEQNPRAVEEYVRTFVKLGRKALGRGDLEQARDLFLLPLSNPVVLLAPSGGAAPSAELQFWLGEALQACGHLAAAHAYWQKAVASYSAASPKSTYTESTLFVALAFARLGERQQSRRLLRELWFAGRRIAREKPDSPPPVEGRTPVLKSDHTKRQHTYGLLLQAQARVGLGQYKLAGRLLEQLLRLDPNRGRALDLISDLQQPRQ